MISFQTARPEDIEFTAHVTMTLSEWRKLSEQLKSRKEPWLWPACDLIDGIRDVVAQAEREFEPPPKDPRHA